MPGSVTPQHLSPHASIVVQVQGVTKTYDAGEMPVEALRGVEFEVRGGEFVSIMGPSGSGKSTLLNLLGGIEAPTSGRIFLESVDLATLDDDQRTDHSPPAPSGSCFKRSTCCPSSRRVKTWPYR